MKQPPGISPPTSGAPAASPSGLNPPTWMSKKDFIDFLGRRIKRTNESLRSAKDRAQKAIDSAVKTGQLTFNARGRVRFDEAILWAVTKPRLRPFLTDFPPPPIALEAHMAAGASLSAQLDTAPGTLAECQSALLAITRRIRELEADLAQAHDELLELRPKAARYDELAAKNRQNARRPRKQ